MTEFRVEVVRIGKIEKHPNADSLSITHIHGGYPVIFRTDDYREGDLAVYVPVDALVPGNDERWKFLSSTEKAYHRIQARKLRGIFSMGCLTPLSWVASEGEDAADTLGITKYLTPDEINIEGVGGKKGNSRLGPRIDLPIPHYDLEGYRKYKNTFVKGEPVIITEKLHGTNARFIFLDGKLQVGSRNIAKAPNIQVRPFWTKLMEFFTLYRLLRGTNLTMGERIIQAWEDQRGAPKDVYWRTAEDYDLETKLAKYPGYGVYGEIYGDVQDLKYGCRSGETKFAVFDVYHTLANRWLDHDEVELFCSELNLPMVPMLWDGDWDESLVSYAEGLTTIPNACHVREGIVIRPIKERTEPGLGRVILKLAGEGYLLRNGDKKRKVERFNPDRVVVPISNVRSPLSSEVLASALQGPIHEDLPGNRVVPKVPRYPGKSSSNNTDN